MGLGTGEAEGSGEQPLLTLRSEIILATGRGGMKSDARSGIRESNAYELFILALTVYSLVIMVALLLPWLSAATVKVLIVYDNAICLVFLFDFGLQLKRAPSKRGYFVHGGGWLDLLGSIPSLGVFRFTGLFRLARLSRLARITTLLGGQSKRQLMRDILQNRGEYAAFVTFLSAIVVLSLSSVMVLQFESRSGHANIKTGGQALWWAIVTLTTVGYGDTYPTTVAARVVAVVVMLAGVGIIAALASILARVLIPTPDESEEATALTEIQRQLADLHRELRNLRQSIAAQEPGKSEPD
jgi:voltage-gated potassium channel